MDKDSRIPGLFGMYKDFCRTRHTCCSSRDLRTNWPLGKRIKGTRNSMFSRLFPIPVVQAAGPEEINPTETQNPLNDIIAKVKPEIIVTDKEVQDYISKISGWDRLRIMFEIKSHKQQHPNLALVTASATSTAAIACFFGYIAGGAAGREQFLMKAPAKSYKSKFFALRAYQDAMMMGGLRMGLKWGFKGGIFVLLFMMTSQVISTYRNKTSVWEYMAGGTLTAAILRSNLGLKGIVGGGFIGLVLGTVGGSLMYLTLKLGNETQEQRNYREVYQQILDEREFAGQEDNIATTSTTGQPIPAVAAS